MGAWEWGVGVVLISNCPGRLLLEVLLLLELLLLLLLLLLLYVLYHVHIGGREAPPL